MMRIILCFLILNVWACNSSNGSNDCENAESFEIIDLSSLAGCQLMLQDSGGERFEPTNLLDLKPEVKAGDKIMAQIKVEPDLAGICQAGKIVSIICIK